MDQTSQLTPWTSRPAQACERWRRSGPKYQIGQVRWTVRIITWLNFAIIGALPLTPYYQHRPHGFVAGVAKKPRGGARRPLRRHAFIAWPTGQNTFQEVV
jgi:hypothetical protein